MIDRLKERTRREILGNLRVHTKEERKFKRGRGKHTLHA